MTNRLVCIGLLAVALSGQTTDDVTKGVSDINQKIDSINKGIDSANRLMNAQNQIIELTLKYILDSVKKHPEDEESARELIKKISRINNGRK